MKDGFKALALAAGLGCALAANPAAKAQDPPQQQPAAQVPDAPTPKGAPKFTGTDGPITPGKGAGAFAQGNSTSNTPDTLPAPAPPVPSKPTASVVSPPSGLDSVQQQTPELGNKAVYTFGLNSNYVDVPVTVKDSKGNLVAGLTWRDFTVYENNSREALRVFSVDPTPLSIAFVIDRTLPSNVMEKVNASLAALQGALTPYDEVAVFSYDNGTKEWTGFTGAQSTRLPFVLSLAKSTGTDGQVPISGGGPFGACPIVTNTGCMDPTIQQGGSTGNPNFFNIPKEIHTLNDAILAAAKELSTRPRERRRVIYVVSDGKEYGSKATEKEVVRYLQTNKTAVFGTLVGDSARFGEGFISRIHLPFTMYDNILWKYTAATGGDLDAEGSMNGIEKSYAKIAAEARNQYTLGYYSTENFIDNKFRKIEVRVDRPDLQVTSKLGYYPSARDAQQPPPAQ